MPAIELKATPRTVVGKRVGALRRTGWVPAILYGAGVEPTPIQLEARVAARALGRASGSTLFDLSVEGETHKVLVREIQRDPIRRDLRHVDFLQVAMDQTIRAEVPIELTGEAPAVKTLGGILVTGVSAIEVEALPGDLPDRITVNLSGLEKIDDSISVRQLPVGEGVKVLTNPDEVVAHVVFQAAEVVEEEVKEAVPAEAEPEVISRGKKEEEEGAEPTPEA